MTTQIKFGTSGWRAIIAEEFTIANIRRAVTGIARYVVGEKASRAQIIVGRDPRYMGERFVEVATEILATAGIKPLVIPEPAPTPAIAFEVIRLKTEGAINFTASHNPAEYNGIKFSTPDGAPALPEVTKKIEAEVLAGDTDTTAPMGHAASEKIEVKSDYLNRLREIIDLAAIKKGGVKVAFDSLHGASRGYS